MTIGARSFRGNVSTFRQNRSVLRIGQREYDVIHACERSHGVHGGKVTLQTPSPIASTVRNDFGHFLALYHLTPFALKVTDPTALAALKDANLVISPLWDADRSLVPARQHFSDEWITDRSKLLDLVTKANKADDTTLDGPQLDANWTFYDKATDTTVEVDASTFLSWWLPEHGVPSGTPCFVASVAFNDPVWRRCT